MKYLTFLIPLVLLYGCKTDPSNQCHPSLSFHYPDSVYFAPATVSFTPNFECASFHSWHIREKGGEWDTTMFFNPDTLFFLFKNPGIYTITLNGDLFFDDTVLSSSASGDIEILEK